MTTALVPLFVALFLCCSIYGATTNLNPVADTTLFEVTPNNNLGRSSLAVGSVALGGGGRRGRGLLQFDLSGIPTNATIDAATLSFQVIQGPFGGVASTFRVHRFLKPWTEGTGSGNQGQTAQAGETTWNSQFHGTAPWVQAGSASGTEYVATASGDVLVDSSSAYAISDAGLAADVQAWVSGSATNHGWIMISYGEGIQRTARRVGSRESFGSAPSLSIEYTLPPPEPTPQIASVARTNDQFEVRFTVPSTYCYEVQFRDSLTTGAWGSLTNICAPASDISAVAVDSLAHTQRYYRLFISGRVR